MNFLLQQYTMLYFDNSAKLKKMLGTYNGIVFLFW